ncbi:hypothetical protein V6N13_097537 [Hibiscus sabdariffa]
MLSAFSALERKRFQSVPLQGVKSRVGEGASKLSPSQNETSLAKAKASLEVCEMSGLHFNEKQEVMPKRCGLRQGFPLSQILFNLVAKPLSALLKKATTLGFFGGFLIDLPTIEVSHIQFTDNLIIFCGAVDSQIKNVT